LDVVAISDWMAAFRLPRTRARTHIRSLDLRRRRVSRSAEPCFQPVSRSHWSLARCRVSDGRKELVGREASTERFDVVGRRRRSHYKLESTTICNSEIYNLKSEIW